MPEYALSTPPHALDEAWPLDSPWAIKIVLNDARQGNAARLLRGDNLGKCLAAALLRMEIDKPQGNHHQ